MNVTFTNNFENVIDLDYPLRIVYGMIFMLFQLFALTCYSGLIYFEHYGGDPMKRSIKNKLISQGLLALMAQIVVNNSGFAWRIIIGPLSQNISIFVLFIRNVFAITVFLCITEFVSFKVFMLYGWSYFCSMDEAFLSHTILTFNFLFGFCTQMCRWMLGSLETHGYELLSGVLLSNSVRHKRYFWPVMIVISFIIIFIGLLALGIRNYQVYKTNKNRIQDIHVTLQNQQSNFNTETHNRPLLGIGTMLGF